MKTFFAKSHLWAMSALVLGIGLAMSACSSIRMIECDTQEEDGSHIRITNQERLGGGVFMRMCEYVTPEKKTYYGIELDLTNQFEKARKGNLFKIKLTNGNVITLKNLYDAAAEVKEEVDIQRQTNYYTDFVPVYDAWYDAVYAAPVTGAYTTGRPTVRREANIKMYYIVTPDQVGQISKNEVESILIVGDEKTITRSPSNMSEQLAALWLLLTGGKK